MVVSTSSKEGTYRIACLASQFSPHQLARGDEELGFGRRWEDRQAVLVPSCINRVQISLLSSVSLFQPVFPIQPPTHHIQTRNVFRQQHGVTLPKPVEGEWEINCDIEASIPVIV